VDAVAWTGGGAQQLTLFHGQLFYFLAVGGNQQLWRTDGTAAGTAHVADLNTNSSDENPPMLAELDGRLYFFAAESPQGGALAVRLWSTDGTEAGTAQAVSFGLAPADSFSPSSLVAAGGHLYIVGSASGQIAASGLWVSDGTDGGTALIAPGIVIATNAMNAPPIYVEYQGRLLFAGLYGNPVTPGALWISDGTAAGTGPLLDAGGQQVQGVRSLRVFSGKAVFFASGGLWQTDGTPAGTKPVPSPGIIAGEYGQELVVAGSRLYFNAYDRAVGDQLWALRPD
jgi:ELWxxDGT repeat protein